MNALRVFVHAALVVLTSTSLVAAENDSSPQRFESNIRAFEESDRNSQRPAGGILFVGSSSIRKWNTARWFPEKDVLNRGFGGSQISDVNHFADRVVLAYKPKTIVFYAGDNDIGKGKKAETVLRDYQTFLNRVANELPSTHVVFIPIKPSPKRWDKWNEMKRANQQIRELTHRRFNWHYAETAEPMLGEDGRPRQELFVEDDLHLSEAGYQLWTTILQGLLTQIEVAQEQPLARGVVFHDRNGNEERDADEKPLAGIRVSNGRDIVLTDAQGQYELPVDDDDIIFVLKPRGYRTKLTDDMLPHFYYIHKPNGSPKSRFPGVAATGPLPKAIDFPLYEQKEPQQFRAILFGDPQPRDQKEVNYVANDVVQELIGTDASFGVTLGDIVFDNLELFESQNRAIALVGIPWYNVIGNHDVNMDAKNDTLSDESFERVFGPAYYSFDYGPVHFVVLDDIEWYVAQEGQKGRYRGGLGEEQMDFIRKDLSLVPDDQLVVLMMHIPLTGVRDREELYRLIEKRKFCMSVSGHTHHHEHRFIKKRDGWRGAEPHHHVINVTVSGSWWSGAPDERGIPHTMMADGAPNGYSIVSFDGQQYRFDFKAAGRSSDYQMNIQVPSEIKSDSIAKTPVYVNVFNGSERSKVEMRLGSKASWEPLKKVGEVDPLYRRTALRENTIPLKPWRNLPGPKPSSHLWRGRLPDTATPGTWLLEVRTTDRHGRVYQAGRVVRILPSETVEKPSSD